MFRKQKKKLIHIQKEKNGNPKKKILKNNKKIHLFEINSKIQIKLLFIFFGGCSFIIYFLF